MIVVYVRPVEKMDQEEINNILDSLSASAVSRLNRKRNEMLHLASLCALALIPAKMRADLCYDESGKPFFATSDADISISHSLRYAAVAITTSQCERVGVDVEETDNLSKRNSLLRFFTENERKLINEGTSEIEIWTKKEALFKYLKKDNPTLISLDSVTATSSFTTVSLGDSLITVCSGQDSEIKFIYE